MGRFPGLYRSIPSAHSRQVSGSLPTPWMRVSIASFLELGECHCFRSFAGTACDKSGIVYRCIGEWYMSIGRWLMRTKRPNPLSIHDVSSDLPRVSRRVRALTFMTHRVQYVVDHQQSTDTSTKLNGHQPLAAVGGKRESWRLLKYQ